ncbi:MAG: rhodanese-related sulfurtransferase [Microvirga sp.]
MTFKVAALYRFTALPDFREIREPLRRLCDDHAIKGTLLLAPEGINGTIAGAPGAIDAVLAAMTDGDLFGRRLDPLELKLSVARAMPFRRLKVRLKREIVTLGAPGADPTAGTGTAVLPAEWNALLDDPDITVIDVRNDFEVAMGTFAGALNPRTARFGAFRDFVREALDPAKHRKIAMFCTGGIRCEKASALLLSQGFPEVFQLKGGILGYLEAIPEAESRWRGGCFVFDERIALGHGLRELAGAAGPPAEGVSSGE